QEDETFTAHQATVMPLDRESSTMVCLCERIPVTEIVQWIRKGVRDINQLKALTRIGMGACGAKTCDTLLKQLLKQESICTDDITNNTNRPVFVEVPLEKFAVSQKSRGGENE
ncbi:MAG: (2Fe-2S)-binding protein, partial [Candidatus Cloacimonetes bacterium]|nr:(2Fe-2S)-binding protein [Candidatus Cloacimonadota bacterium]